MMSYFAYAKKLDKGSSKLKYFVSTSKTIIFSLEKENKNLLKEIDSLEKNKIF